MSKRTTGSAARTAVSLFSGCGGFDIGFHRAGYKIFYAADHDQYAVESYNRNLAPVAEIADLRQGVSSEARRTQPECVFAGPPCQGFSTAGKRNPSDPRSHLLPQAGKLALEFSPKVIVIENVLGVRVGHPAQHWDALVEMLRHARYHTHDIVCDGRNLGLAQSRRRVFLFAWRTDRSFPTLTEPKPWGRLDEVLAGVEQLSDHCPESLVEGSRLYRIAQRIGPGQKLCNVRGGPRSVHTWHLPEVFGSTTARECLVLETLMRLRRQERVRDFGDADPVRLTRLVKECGKHTERAVQRLKSAGYIKDKDGGLDLAHSFNGKFRRFRWDDVACTVDTRFGDPHLFLHPNEHRPFTVREAARIQDFPDDYVIAPKDRHFFRVVGNAVPPQMGQFAADIATKLAC